MPQSSPHFTDSHAKDPDFIRARLHIGRFVTTAVNTEAEQANIQALRGDLDSAFLHVNVSPLLLFKIYRLPFDSNSFHYLENHRTFPIKG
jgi:hypothetical protein